MAVGSAMDAAYYRHGVSSSIAALREGAALVCLHRRLSCVCRLELSVREFGVVDSYEATGPRSRRTVRRSSYVYVYLFRSVDGDRRSLRLARGENDAKLTGVIGGTEFGAVSFMNMSARQPSTKTRAGRWYLGWRSTCAEQAAEGRALCVEWCATSLRTRRVEDSAK